MRNQLLTSDEIFVKYTTVFPRQLITLMQGFSTYNSNV